MNILPCSSAWASSLEKIFHEREWRLGRRDPDILIPLRDPSGWWKRLDSPRYRKRILCWYTFWNRCHASCAISSSKWYYVLICQCGEQIRSAYLILTEPVSSVYISPKRSKRFSRSSTRYQSTFKLSSDHCLQTNAVAAFVGGSQKVDIRCNISAMERAWCML